MPEFRTITVGLADFVAVADGYIDAVIATHGVTSLEGGAVSIDVNDLDYAALMKIQKDCKQFYSIATAVAGGKTALVDQISLDDLGFHFFLSRQGAGLRFVDLDMDSRLAAELDDVANSMGRLEVEVRDRSIRILGAKALDAPVPFPSSSF